MNSRTFNAEGIVVRTRNLGESDRIVILLTPNRGLVHCVARSARNTKSKIGGQTDLLRHITAGLRTGRSDLHIINQVETINAHLGLHTDLDRLTLASHMAETGEQFSTEGVANPDGFNLLRESLTHAESANRDKLPLLRLWHDVQLLTVSGWEPELHNCVRTGIELSEGDHWWSATEGGVVAQSYTDITSQQHSARTAAPASHDDPTLTAPLTPAPVNALKLLRYITRPTTTWQRLSTLNTTTTQTNASQTLITRLTEAVLDTRESRSARVARAVRGGARR